MRIYLLARRRGLINRLKHWVRHWSIKQYFVCDWIKKKLKSVKTSFPTSSAFYYLYFSPSWKIYILCIKAAISIPDRLHFPRLYLWQTNLHFPQIYFYTLKNPDTLREHYRIIICYGNSVAATFLKSIAKWGRRGRCLLQ